MKVGDLVAYLTLDASQYEAGASKAQSAINAVGTAGKAATQVIATGMATAATGAVAMGVSLAKVGTSYNILQQNSRAALLTLLGSQTKVNDQMAKLNELTQRSPFGKDIFIQAQQQLISFGMSAEKVVPTLDAIQNAVAATGGSATKLSEITYVLAQVQAAGKVTAVDLMQLGQRGVDAATLVGSQMGKTGAEIRQMITKGQISATDFIDNLTKGMAAKFGGATDNIKKQWTGAADRIKAAWRDTGSVIAAPFIDPNGGGKAVEWANLVADIMRSVQQDVTAAMRYLDTALGPTFDRITTGLRDANVAAQKFNIGDVLEQVRTLSKYTPLISGASAALVTLGVAPIPGLGKLSQGMTPVLVGIATLVATSPELRKVGAAFTDALAPAKKPLEDVTTSVADLAMTVISEASPGLTRMATSAGDLVVAMVPMAQAAIDVLNAMTPLVGVGADVLAWVAGLPEPVLIATAAIVGFHKPLTDIVGVVGSMGKVLGNARAWIAMFADSWVTARANSVPNIQAIGKAADDMGVGMKSAGAAIGAAITPAGLLGAGITVLVGVLAIAATNASKAKAEIQAYGDTLDEVTGAVTDSSVAMAKKNALDKGLDETAQKLGVSLTTVAEAATGNKDAQQELNDAIDASNKRMSEQLAATGQGSEATVAYRTEIGDLKNFVYDTADGIGELQTEQDKLRDATEEATQAAKDQADALQGVYDAIKKQAAANGDLVAAQYAAADATEKGNQLIADGTRIVRDAAGHIDNYADSTRKIREQALAAAQAYNDQSQSAMDAGKSQADLDAITEANTKSFMDFAEAAGYSSTEAAALAREVGLIPDRKSVVVDMTADTTRAKTDIQALLDETKDSKGNIVIDATTDPAAAKLAEALGLVSDSEGMFSINADDEPALAALFASLGLINTSTGTITMAGDNAEAQKALAEALNITNGSTGTMGIEGNPDAVNKKITEALRKMNTSTGRLTIDALSGPADNTLSRFIAKTNQSAGYVKVNAKDNGALGTAQGIANRISGLQAFIKVNAVQVPSSIAKPNADGNIWHFANGTENHIAQIARAGDWRVWAEDETGGEAYIPLAPSKRSRSLAITRQVAETFGYAMVPMGARRYVDGSTPSSTSSPVGLIGTALRLDLGGITIVDRNGQILAVLETAAEDVAISVVNSARK